MGQCQSFYRRNLDRMLCEVKRPLTRLSVELLQSVRTRRSARVRFSALYVIILFQKHMIGWQFVGYPLGKPMPDIGESHLIRW
mgnify:CR=1 FL=1